MNWPSRWATCLSKPSIIGAVRHRRGHGLGRRDGIFANGGRAISALTTSCCCSSTSNWAPWSGFISRPTTCRCAFLIYVAITALTRLLISNVSHHNPPDMGVVYLTGAILLLAFAILVVRYASSQFPKIENPHRKTGAGSGEHPEVEKGEL